MAVMRAGGGGGGTDDAGGVGKGVGAGMSGFMASAASLKTAAAEGKFAADPESGRALIDVFRKRLSWAQRMRFDLDRLSQEPALGSSPGANTYKPFFASLATDPSEGIASQWDKFIQVLQDTADAIEQSMKNYQETDTGQASNINNISGQIYEV